MSDPHPIILIVEDSRSRQGRYADALAERITLLQALTIEQGQRLFDENPDIALIVMDGCVDNDDRPDTEPLIRNIRETFKGPIIAASSSEYYRRILMTWGCDHEAEKANIPAKVLELLGLNPTP